MLGPAVAAAVAFVAKLFKGASVSGRRGFLSRYTRKARRYWIGEFPDGKYGRVVGHARAYKHVLTAPISGLPCLFYILRVVHADARDRNTGDPVAVAREVSNALFFVEDRTGRALIDPRGALGFLGFETASDLCHRPPSAVVWLLQAQGQRVHTRLHYTEWIIPPDAMVSVMGGGTREPDPDAPPAPEYRGEPVMRLRIAKTEPYALMISDDPETFR